MRGTTQCLNLIGKSDVQEEYSQIELKMGILGEGGAYRRVSRELGTR